SPVPRQNHSTSRTIARKVVTWPQEPRQTIKVSTIRETSRGINGQVSGTGIQVTGNYNTRNALNTEKMSDEWKMKLDGCLTTGSRWSYSREDGSYTSNFIS
ncbi:5144_t:CDS:1, partial [Ambispora leptoticha]